MASDITKPLLSDQNQPVHHIDPPKPHQKLDPRLKLAYRKIQIGEWNPADKKVNRAAGYAMAGIKIFGSWLSGAIFSVFTLVRSIRRLFSSEKTMEKQHHVDLRAKVSEVQMPVPDDNQKLNEFAREIDKLKDDVTQKKLHPDEIRIRIKELSKQPIYQEHLKTEKPPAAVIYLRDLGEKLESTDGVATFSEYGKSKIDAYLPAGDEPVTYTDFCIALGKAQADEFSNRDNPISTALWGAMHPHKVSHVEDAHLHSKDYDSYESQAVFLSVPLVDDEHAIVHKYTPGLTGPTSIVEDVLLPQLRAEGRRMIQIGNQSTHKKDERDRLNLVKEMADRNKDVFLQAVISTDTPGVVNEKLIKYFVKNKDADVESFIELYEEEIRGPNDLYVRNYDLTRGIYIPTELLNKEELSAAFTAAKNMVLESPAYKDLAQTKEGRKQLVNIIQRSINSTLSWAIMKKEQLNHPNSIFTENCKENIDRGPMENMGVVFLDRIMQGEQMISRADAYLQAGITLGRAQYAMDRSPQQKRMVPFLDWLMYIDCVGSMKDIAKKELEKLRLVLAKPVPVGRQPVPVIDPAAEHFAEFFAQDQSEFEKKSASTTK